MINIQPQTKFETLKTEYKALVEQLKIELGTLESIRWKLALSRRQICKLLMVDPSAWTRWTRRDADAPPHIYQALKWYMQLIEKNPDVHAPLKLEQRMDLMQKEFLNYVSHIENKKEAPQAQEPQKEDSKKALELEIIRYDNKRLQEKIATLETKLTTIALNYEQVLVNLEKKQSKPKAQPKTKVKAKPKKKKLRKKKKSKPTKKTKKKGKSKKTSLRKKKRKK